MSRGARTRIATGIYSDQYGVSVVVKHRGERREERFAPDTPMSELERHRARMRTDLLEDQAERAPDDPEPARGTFAADIPRYLKQIAGRVAFKSDRSHLRAWIPIIGSMRRAAVKASHVREAIAAWQSAGTSARTIRHRRRVLRELYQALDGINAKPPTRGVKTPRPPDPHPVPIAYKDIRRVARSLRKGKRHARGYGSDSDKGYARFLVRATTGQRPSQIMRAQPADVDLKRKIWWVRPGKGGNMIPLPLDAEMVKAWKIFMKADAWGLFDARSFSKLLRRHGWPAGVRPYNLRHTFAIDLLLHGADISDVAGFLGHKDSSTTRRHYTGVVLARLRKIAAKRNRRIA